MGGHEGGGGEDGGGDGAAGEDARSDAGGGATVAFVVTLNNVQEVGGGVDTVANGTGQLTLDTNAKTLKGSIMYSGLTAPPTGSHIHAGMCGQNGAVTFSLSPPAATSGTINVDLKLGSGDITLAATEALYVNIHTPTYPAGEIRGQILKAAGGSKCP